MNESLLKSYYEKRGFDKTTTDQAIFYITSFEKWLKTIDYSFETLSTETVRAYIQASIETMTNTPNNLLALARYFYLIDRKDIYIYFTSLLGGLGVIESITERLQVLKGQEQVDLIFSSLEKPPLGSEPSGYPQFTQQLMERLETHLSEETVKKVLAGNNHGIPREAYLEERQIYAEAVSLDAYLADYNKRKILELQDHCDQNKVWYEQVITQEVVDYAASNQEIMSAVREGDILYVTKIPYAPARYLSETDPLLKRYYACHCPFAREAILTGEPHISSNWCYCSAGYAKYPYEILFERELKVEMLESALKGDPTCRFAIYLKE